MRTGLAVVLLFGCGRSEPFGEAMQVGTLCQAVMTEPQVKELATWPAGACLDVTFEQGAGDHAARLHAALLEWAAAPGTWLCFNPPVAAEASAPRTVHVKVGSTNGPALSLATVDYTGSELTRAEVTFSDEHTFTHGMFLQAAGQLLGFQRTEGVESVLNAYTPGEVLPMLSEADLQSVAAVYPACR